MSSIIIEPELTVTSKRWLCFVYCCYAFEEFLVTILHLFNPLGIAQSIFKQLAVFRLYIPE